MGSGFTSIGRVAIFLYGLGAGKLVALRLTHSLCQSQLEGKSALGKPQDVARAVVERPLWVDCGR